MRILLLGKDGQVGWELQRALAPLGELMALGRAGQQTLCGDLSKPADLAVTVERLRPDVIVNAAAYTAVDQAESEPDQAQLINAQAPAALANAAARSGALLVHYSTDYVFNGSGDTPWREDDKPEPLSQYGRSKLEGEEAIRAAGCRHLILRTSWVYGTRGRNFARTMLRLASERDTLRVVNDQIGAPTGAELIADVTSLMLSKTTAGIASGGTYHLAAAGETSWHGFACEVIKQAREQGGIFPLKHLQGISTPEYPTPAIRPLNSRLNCNKLRDTFSLVMPDWRLGVQRMIKELEGNFR